MLYQDFEKLWNEANLHNYCTVCNRLQHDSGMTAPFWRLIAWCGESPQRCCHQGASQANMSLWIAASNETGYFCEVKIKAESTRGAVLFRNNKKKWKHNFELGPAIGDTPCAGYVKEPEPVIQDKEEPLYELFRCYVQVIPELYFRGDTIRRKAKWHHRPYLLCPKLDYKNARSQY